MIENVKNQQLVNIVVNGTYRPINLYDDTSGVIFTFEPVPRHERHKALASLPNCDCTGKANGVIILDKTLVKKFKNAGGDLAELAYVRSSSVGRTDLETPHISWDGSRFHCELKPVEQPLEIADIISARNREVHVRLRNVCGDFDIDSPHHSCAAHRESVQVS